MNKASHDEMQQYLLELKWEDDPVLSALLNANKAITDGAESAKQAQEMLNTVKENTAKNFQFKASEIQKQLEEIPYAKVNRYRMNFLKSA